MGFLDSLFNPKDETQAAAMAAAFSLLGQQGYGNAGLAGLNAAMQFKERQGKDQRQKLQDQLMQYQLADMRRQQEIAALPGQFAQPASIPPTMDNRDIGTPGAGSLVPPSFDTQGYLQALMGKSPMQALQLQQAMQKDKPQPIKLGQGDTLVDPTTFRPLAQGQQKQEQEPEAIRTLKLIYGEGTPAYKAALERLGMKQTTHTPGVSVSYGAPVAGVDAQGNPVFFQPDKSGGAPSIIPGVAPPKPANPVEFNKTVTGLNELANGLASYEKTLKENNGSSPIALGKRRAALQGAYTSLQMGLKNAFELGALAGPDLSLLQGMLVDPTSPQAALIGDKGIEEQIRQAHQYLKNRGAAVYKAHSKPVPPEYADTPAKPNVDDLVNKYRSR